MGKIGILLPTIKEVGARQRKNNSFDSLEYAGFNHIINEIDREKHTVEFCSGPYIDGYDYVLYSIIDPLEQINLRRCLLGKENHKTRIIIGGAGLTNIRPISDVVDIAVFGRAEVNAEFDLMFLDRNPDLDFELSSLSLCKPQSQLRT